MLYCACTSPTFYYYNWRLVYAFTLRVASQTDIQMQRAVIFSLIRISFNSADFFTYFTKALCTPCLQGTSITQPERLCSFLEGNGMTQDMRVEWNRQPEIPMSALPQLSRRGMVTSERKGSGSALFLANLSHQWLCSPLLQ